MLYQSTKHSVICINSYIRIIFRQKSLVKAFLSTSSLISTLVSPVLSFPVHLLVVLHIIPGCALLHPVHMLLIPLYRKLYTILKHGRRCPAKLRHSLQRINGIPLVMPLAIRNICDQAPLTYF